MSAALSLLREPQVAPSILAADFGRLAEQVETVLDAGARVIHVDVMDGCFVEPISFGTVVVEAIAEQVHDVGALLDVHLMVDRPERHVDAFARAGADVLTIHAEATPQVHRTLWAIRRHGLVAGLALSPGTPVDAALAVADAVDLVLCMTVDPGWGGQPFLTTALPRIAALRRGLPPEVVVEVDGGIGPATVADVTHAGASLLVAGSAVFGSPDPAAAFLSLNAGAGATTSPA